MYALGDRLLGFENYDIHMIKIDFSPGSVQASYHSLVEISSREENSVLFARFKDSQLYAMGGLRRVIPGDSRPKFYDSKSDTRTGYLLKYSAIVDTASLADSCFYQKTISYQPSGFNPIKQSWVDPVVSPAEEQLSKINPRSFSEASTGFKSADIKQAEVLVEKTDDVFSSCVGVSSYSFFLAFNAPALNPLTYFMNIVPEGPTFVDCPAFQLISTGNECTDPLISYELTDSNYNPLPSGFVFTEAPNRRLDWSLAKSEPIQITIVVNGVLPDGISAGRYSFQVNIVDCASATVQAISDISSNYQVNQAQVFVSIDGVFTQSEPLCQLEYILEAESGYSYHSDLFSVIQVSQDSSQIQIYAANNDYIGIFFLQVRAKVKNGGTDEDRITVRPVIAPQCSLSKITQTAVSSKTYILPGNYDLVVADLNWVQQPLPDTPAGNGCEKMIYELIDVNTNVAVSPNLFFIDALTQSKFLFTTNDYLLAGTTYNLMLSAYIQDPSGQVLVRSTSSPFTVQILRDSPQNEVTPLSQNVLTPLRKVNYQEYIVGDTAIEFYVTWAESVGESGGIAYSISMMNGASLPADGIQFDADFGKFTVSTKDRKQAGLYAIKVTGQLKNMINVTASQVFKVRIKDFCEEPSIIIPSQMSPLSHVLGQKKQIIAIPPWSDSHKGLCGTFTFFLNYRSYPALAKVVTLSQDQKSLIIKSTTDSALSGKTFSITVRGSLQSRASKQIYLKISFKSAIQKETIKISDSPQQQQISPTTRQPLLGRILSIDTEGGVTLRFNMSINGDYDKLEAIKERIKVTIRGDNSLDGEPTLASIKSWAFEKTRVHDQEIIIRVEFAESRLVSIRSEVSASRCQRDRDMMLLRLSSWMMASSGLCRDGMKQSLATNYHR